MLSTSCKYALRAALFLMTQSKQQKKAGIKEIAEKVEANEHTTGKILQLLVKEKIIASSKGPNGGFYIELKAKPIHLIDIVKVVDGLDFFFECGLGLNKCLESKPCSIHASFKAARDELYNEFSSLTIQKLATDLNKGKAFLKL